MWSGSETVFTINDNDGECFEFRKLVTGHTWATSEALAHSGVPASQLDLNTPGQVRALASVKETDLLVLGIRQWPHGVFASRLDVNGRAALYSLGFLLRRAAADLLDVDERELKVGLRVVRDLPNGEVTGQVFISDSLENGAGYSSRLGRPDQMRDSLQSCPKVRGNGATKAINRVIYGSYYPYYEAGMPSLKPEYLTALGFSGGQLASIQRLGEARGRQQLFVQQAPQQLDALRQSAVIESSESSSRIEGVIAAPGRVAQLVMKRVAPRDRSEQEIAGYRDALQLIHDSHHDMPFTANVILQMHGMLFRYLPSEGGHWKAADNEVVERDAAGTTLRVRFKPTPAVSTPQAIDEFTADYHRATRDPEGNPLVLIPLAILDLLCIHPFRDGNGRVARLSALLLLYQSDYRVGRYISLERIIEESKETYYEALERSSSGWHDSRHDPHPWLDYVWGILIRAYGEFEARVATLKGSKTDQIRAAVLRRTGPFGISDIEADSPGISRDMVRHVLRRMKSEGLIAPTGLGRGAKWRRVVVVVR